MSSALSAHGHDRCPLLGIQRQGPSAKLDAAALAGRIVFGDERHGPAGRSIVPRLRAIVVGVLADELGDWQPREASLVEGLVLLAQVEPGVVLPLVHDQRRLGVSGGALAIRMRILLDGLPNQAKPNLIYPRLFYPSPDSERKG